MKRNQFKNKLIRGEKALNGWLTVPSSFVAEIMASLGYDALTLDMQHGCLDYADALALLQGLKGHTTTPLVRVPWCSPADIAKVLDAGAEGIICPMINTKEDAELLASYVRYPPIGKRSYGPIRASLIMGDNYGSYADEEILCFAMIETSLAVKNSVSILNTKGIDGVYIGPADLTLGLTGKKYRFGFDRTEKEIISVIQELIRLAKESNKFIGLHCGAPEYAKQAVEWGVDFVTVSSDARLLKSAAEQSIKDFRSNY